MPGTLYVVATPIGNLEDLSPRAERILRGVALVACEDTRRTGKLLARHGIVTRRVSCHKFNERRRLEPILAVLRSGEDVALVSDGGTPGVSDPGARLVRAAHEERVPVVPVPGPSAGVALLSASGLSSERYVFEGFLPHRAGERRRRLRELRDETRTIVAFETPHRIHGTLCDLEAVFGDRHVVLGRELTKVHESVSCGSAAEIEAGLGEEPVRGEITLVIAGAGETRETSGRDAAAERTVAEWRRSLADSDVDRRRALRTTARRLGIGRAELQRRLDELGLE